MPAAPPLHPTLARQLRRHLGGAPDEPRVAALVAAVDAHYRDLDRERALVVHSLETTSAELVQRHERLQRSEAAYRLLFEQSPLPMWVYTPERGDFLAANDASVARYGYTRDEFLRMTVADLHPAEDVAVARALLASAAESRRHVAEVRHHTRAGEVVWAEVTGHPVEWGGAAARLVLATDVTERRRMEEQLRRQAFHDELTGLANRALFVDRVEHAVARGGRASCTPTIFFLDLDGFKKVNDSLGHSAGDRLLQVVAERLTTTLRGGDTVARFGGDEFAVLLDPLTPADTVDHVADRVLAAVAAPLVIDGREVGVSASVGIAAHRAAGSAAELLRDADAAMYAAKGAGRGRAARFDPEMHRRAIERLDLEADLRRAEERGELRLVFQPLCDLESGMPHGVEALVRWQHPRFGAVSPGQFIPIAEETGLILPIGRWVLREACRQMSEWRRALGPDGCLQYVSVNVSGRQLESETFVSDVREVLRDSGLAPAVLTLEITESVIMRDAGAALRRLHELKALGVRLAVDDFGTGYSSLSYLQRFPVDVLKIDKSFVDGVAAGAGAAALVRTIVALSESLQLHLVAEGIEHPEQRAALRALGCEVGQGFHLARPAPAAELTERLLAAALPAVPQV